MTEHKYTDEEVIMGLNCLLGEHIVCKKCAYSKINGGFSCKKKVATHALDLINRQRAEIERLKKLSDEGAECPICHGVGKIGITNWLTKDLSKKQIAKEKAESVAEFHRELKAEAVKEFAERIKRECLIDRGYEILQAGTIDDLVKEFTAGKKECPNCKHFVGCETACGGEPCDLFK